MQYGVVVVKSTVWPGAMSYFWRGQWGDIYVGDAQKHEEITYFPISPPVIMEDPDEKPVQPEVSTNKIKSRVEINESLFCLAKSK